MNDIYLIVNQERTYLLVLQAARKLPRREVCPRFACWKNALDRCWLEARARFLEAECWRPARFLLHKNIAAKLDEAFIRMREAIFLFFFTSSSRLDANRSTSTFSLSFLFHSLTQLIVRPADEKIWRFFYSIGESKLQSAYKFSFLRFSTSMA